MPKAAEVTGYTVDRLYAITRAAAPTELAAAIGVSPKSIHRWSAPGACIPSRSADRIAVGLGLVPALIWDWEPE